jgi:hypothetical protein
MHTFWLRSTTAQDWPAAHSVFPHTHFPVAASHVWFTGQATPSQVIDDSQSLVAGLHTSPGAHVLPPVPPHLHVPSS